MDGNAVLSTAITKLHIDLVSLVAETALWADPSVCADLVKKNGTVVWFPNYRRKRNGEKRGTVVNGEKLDDNTYANNAIKRAVGLKRSEIESYNACHIWPNTCYDIRYHTAIPNLVLLPSAIAGLSDFLDEVIQALQYRSFELYNWCPQEYAKPIKPAHYPTNWQMPCLPTKLNRTQIARQGNSSNSKKKETNMNVEAMLRTIGQRTFVEYYAQFANPQNTNQVIQQNMSLREHYTLNSLRTKVSMGKRIFREGLQRDALTICANSARIDAATQATAQRLLNGN